MKTCQSGYFQQARFVLLLSLFSIVVFVTSASALTGNNINACSDCHGVRSTTGTGDLRPVDSTYRNITTGGFIGSHRPHLATLTTSATVCTPCHGPAPILYDHRNGKIDVSAAVGYSKGTFFNQTSVPVLGTCGSATSCHVSPYSSAAVKTPTWGDSTAGCAACHNATSGADAAFSPVYGSPLTGAHTLHMGTGMACSLCHSNVNSTANTSSVHPNGYINVSGYNTKTLAKHTIDTGYTVRCTTIVCHGNNPGSPLWGSITQNYLCTKCHGTPSTSGTPTDPKVAATLPATAAHAIHMAPTIGKAVVCTECHVAVSSTGPASHMNGTNDIAYGGPVGTAGGAIIGATYPSNCLTTWCHGGTDYVKIPQNVPARTAPVWGTSFGTTSTLGNGTTTSGSGRCAKCHGYPPINPTHASKTQASCNGCHKHLSTNGITFTDATIHIDGKVDGGSCTGCHDVGGTGDVNARVAVVSLFKTAGNSHHVQGTDINGTHCYACHWEADSTGSPTSYHAMTNNGVVDLVVWTTTSRPTTWSTLNAVSYQSGGAAASTRAEMQKLNTHCLGCHDDTNKNATTFAGDANTPSTYSWEKKPTTAGGFGLAQSIEIKYMSTTTTAWGKFTGNFTNSKNLQTKGLSAHNNASNARGWNTLAENLQGTAAVTNFPNTSGNVAVLCFDCHNSHGSAASAAAAITSSYSSVTGDGKGAILKNTVAGKGGYTVTYLPGAGGSTAEKNAHKAGAGLCFDCHNNANSGAATLSGSTAPWGYTGTFGSSQAIYGYNDSQYFGKSGATFAKNITYSFTTATANTGLLNTGAMNQNRGGHFGKSSTMINTPNSTHQIGGLCTPCHDPHGVSPGISTPANAVPLLKGTYVTSPYKVDVAGTAISRGGGCKQAPLTGTFLPGYHIDQNTMQASRAMKPAIASAWLFTTTAKSLQTLNSTQFAGLCENCHTKATLNSTAAATTTNWKQSGRIHNAVAGWALTTGTAGNVGNKAHAYTCSKCHTAHNSRLPRLLVTNCLDVRHAGRVTNQTSIFALTTPATASAGGRGRFPGGGGGAANLGTATNPGPWYFGNTASGTAVPVAATTCHESGTAGGTTFNATAQQWNTKSLW